MQNVVKWATVLSYYVILSGLTVAIMTYQAFPDDLRTSVYTKSSAVVYIQKKIYEMTWSDSKESWVNEAMLILNTDRPNETDEKVFSRPFSLANPFSPKVKDSLRSRRLEAVGTRKKGRARKRHARGHPSRVSLARARSLFRPLLPRACYAG